MRVAAEQGIDVVIVHQSDSFKGRTRSKVFMFSGQGSQYFQMGKSLFDGNPVFRHWMLKLDAIAVARTSRSVLHHLYDPMRSKAETFEDLQVTHPAIFMVEFALSRTLIESGVRPDFVLGASLGTFAAAAVAGALPVEDAMASVLDHAAIIQSSVRPGGMIAVLADSSVHGNDDLKHYCDIAAFNCPSHFVVSAHSQGLITIERFLRQHQVMHQRIPVSYAFHSRWIDPAETSCLRNFEALPMARPDIPLICCSQAGEIHSMTAEAWWQVIRRPIDFQSTIARLESEGDLTYIDVGPSGTLATFLKYLLPATAQHRVHRILRPLGGEVVALSSVIRSLQ